VDSDASSDEDYKISRLPHSRGTLCGRSRETSRPSLIEELPEVEELLMAEEHLVAEQAHVVEELQGPEEDPMVEGHHKNQGQSIRRVGKS